jgi:hypothetical protein
MSLQGRIWVLFELKQKTGVRLVDQRHAHVDKNLGR